MARVNVEHGIGDLARDLARIPGQMEKRGAKIVKKDTREGRNHARRFARKESGPHGIHYFKRITDEMVGPLTGEYGPKATKGGPAVGAGYRTGGPNTDLARSTDIIGPKFADDIGDMVEGLFWPGDDQ